MLLAKSPASKPPQETILSQKLTDQNTSLRYIRPADSPARMSNENLAETLFPKPFVLHLYKTYYPKHQHSAPRTKSVLICKNPNRASRYQNIRRIDSIRRYINNVSGKKILAITPASAEYLSSSFFFGRVPSGRAIAQYLSGRGQAQRFKSSAVARPERILAHIPHALRLVASADMSGDHVSTARPECLRAGSNAKYSPNCLLINVFQFELSNMLQNFVAKKRYPLLTHQLSWITHKSPYCTTSPFRNLK